MSKSLEVQHGLHESLNPKSTANEYSGVNFASARGADCFEISAICSEVDPSRLLSMSAYPASEFTVAEKVELLVNILQQINTVDFPSYLLNLILVELHREPQWQDIALPRGRSLHACQIAFEDLRKHHARNPYVSRPPPVTMYQNIAPAPPPGSRSFSEQEPYTLGRRQPPVPHSYHYLRGTESPNPPVSNGGSPNITRNVVATDTATSDAQRKRGRPSKADVEERDRQYAAVGKVYVPKRRHKKPRVSLLPEGGEITNDESATPLLQTPTARSIEPVQDTSSGRRRQRHLRDDSPLDGASADTDVQQQSADQGQGQEQEQEQEQENSIAQSPSDRLLLSHRDRGSVGSSRSRPAHYESETSNPGYYDPGAAT